MINPEEQSAKPPEDMIGARLDDEITSLQSQISSLKAKRNLQTATILSSHATQATLDRLRKAQTQPTPSAQADVPPDTNPLLAASTSQLLHNQENLYRACGTITTFRVRDPDPNAVDNGNVLGIRVDVSTTGKFINPYYLLLNKPFPDSELLRVHRHTLPPYIPLSSLVEKHLPTGKGSSAMSAKKAVGGKRQDLRRLVRALRGEIVAYHNRITAIKNLRKEFKLDEKASRKGKGREKFIADISAADAEAKQIRIEWVDGKIGRCVVDDDGGVVKCVVIGDEGRDREIERAVLRGRIEGIGERLMEGVY
ncbi:Cenp-O kinetochore centromere component [Venustampulla echinocandica]|uniref:Cenp-O kinetochore centromere component n=1 Tax=Venustampulla echinocandica TaxID=2656787 RepID=A0A370TBU3_9HELO|nr:Cenp-O kinetochore centromere component [Venustampulla echinocandica]RDL31507.1 Cenp-O kinetochore centromere component [Venustampulla echinocandica]